MNLKEFNADLHIHSPFSGGVSKYMQIPVLAEQAKLKGLQLLATGDVLNKEWLKHVESNLEGKKGCFECEDFGTQFVLSTEVQDKDNVHQLIFLEGFDEVEELREKLSKFGKLDGKGFGRPWLKLSGEELARKVVECGGLIGPAHAFTPYFSVYSHFDSLQECFGEMVSEVKFLELGLSADSALADLMEGNHSVEFLTASDSHSPWPLRLGREFVRMELEKGNFSELKKAFGREGGRGISLNVGLDPREGKYHCTGCSECYAKYSLEEAEKLRWKCAKCSGKIKKGVRDRILELGKFSKEIHPEKRPPYVHIIPLAEIIKIALGMESENSKKVQSVWRDFVEKFESEISVLIDEPIVQLEEVNVDVANKVEAFRNGWVLFKAGAGGNYGTPVICSSKKEMDLKKIELKNELDCASSFKGQKTLGEF